MFDILIDTLQDTWLSLIFLYVAYCILEVFERRSGEDDDSMFFALQKQGPLFGALFGLIPQCGFSILAAMLFLQNNITLGTLAAVFIATSDEAIPILLSTPSMFKELIGLLGLKFLIGAGVGYFTDRVLFPKQKILLFDDMEEEEAEEDDEEYVEDNNACPCCYTQYPIYISALLRSLKIYAFLFLTSFVLSVGIAVLKEETIEMLLLKGSIFQPAIAALLGFIPNCAITVVLARLYVEGELMFGSLLSGLVTNAGLGLVCLFRYGAEKKDIIHLSLILFVTAFISGVLFL